MADHVKDPYCCLSEKMRAGLEGFDRGYLTAARSLRYAVRALTKDEALALIDEIIAEYPEKCATRA